MGFDDDSLKFEEACSKFDIPRINSVRQDRDHYRREHANEMVASRLICVERVRSESLVQWIEHEAAVAGDENCKPDTINQSLQTELQDLDSTMKDQIEASNAEISRLNADIAALKVRGSSLCLQYLFNQWCELADGVN